MDWNEEVECKVHGCVWYGYMVGVNFTTYLKRKKKRKKNIRCIHKVTITRQCRRVGAILSSYTTWRCLKE